jgi:hypothetical protein
MEVQARAAQVYPTRIRWRYGGSSTVDARREHVSSSRSSSALSPRAIASVIATNRSRPSSRS